MAICGDPDSNSAFREPEAGGFGRWTVQMAQEIHLVRQRGADFSGRRTPQPA
ncbi:MAG: hypothetical protein AB7I59_26240 [Geminicoccaceae bacterium]